MLGAVVGDVIGSVYERRFAIPAEAPLLTEASRFTDDTVFTLAVASSLLSGQKVAQALRVWGHKYPEVGASRQFSAWLAQDAAPPYGGTTNGALMRVSPAVALAGTEEIALEQSRQMTVVSHDSAQALSAVETYARTLFAALNGANHADVLRALDAGSLPLRSVDDIRTAAKFRMGALETLADVYACLAESSDFEGAMRNCLRCGGDVDTLCAITGPVAEALWGISEQLARAVVARLPQEMRAVLQQEYQAIPQPSNGPWIAAALNILTSPRP